MAKIQQSDKMLLSRDQKIYYYTGVDFIDSVLDIIDGQNLPSIFVLSAGDEMTGKLTINANEGFVNAETHQCLELDGAAYVRQLVINPESQDAAHISLSFVGDRDHQVFFEGSSLELVHRDDTGSDKRILQVNPSESITHVGTTLSIAGPSASPVITLNAEGASAFSDRILLGNIEDDATFLYNHVAHKGYVDTTNTLLREEVLDYVQVDVLEDYPFVNINLDGGQPITVEQKQYDLTDTDPPNSGQVFFGYTNTNPTNWQQLNYVSFSKTSQLGAQINDDRFDVGDELTLVRMLGNVDDDYTGAEYTILSKQVTDTHVHLAVEYSLPGDEDPNNNNDPYPLPDPTNNEIWAVQFQGQVDIGLMDTGRFYWEVIPNALDGNNNPVDDWRAVNKLIFSVRDNNGVSISKNIFPVGNNLEVTNADDLFAGGLVITSAENNTITQIDANYNQISKNVIEVGVRYEVVGDDIDFDQFYGALCSIKVASIQDLKDYVDNGLENQTSWNELQDQRLTTIQNDLALLERSAEKGKMAYSATSGNAPSGGFALNAGTTVANSFSDSAVDKIYISTTDLDGATRDWTPGDPFDTTDKSIVFIQYRDDDTKPIQGEYVLNGYTDAAGYTEFDVSHSAGDGNILAANMDFNEFSVKIVSANEGISEIDANKKYVLKEGDPGMSGNFVISNRSTGGTTLQIYGDTGTLTIGDVTSGTQGQLVFSGPSGIVLHRTTPILMLDGSSVDFQTNVDMGSNVLTIPTPIDVDMKHATNVEYVQRYVGDLLNNRIASDTVLGGIKIKSPHLMDGEFLNVEYARTMSLDSDYKRGNMGIAVFDNSVFKAFDKDDAASGGSTEKFRKARMMSILKGSTVDAYGINKLTSGHPIKVDDEHRLYLKYSVNQFDINGDEELFIKAANNSHRAGVKLTDSVTSSKDADTGGFAATPLAVKTAYDHAQSAKDDAKDAKDAADAAQESADEALSKNFYPGDPVAAGSSADTQDMGFYWTGSALYFRG